MIRQQTLKLAVASLTGFFAARTAAVQRPNIVIIFTDDIGYGDISCLNPQSGFKTPAVDALAADGIRLLQAHSTAAVCAPSRYAMLTGNHVFRGKDPSGVWTHCTASQILPGQLTLADVLKKNGYRTAFFGKLHLGCQFHQREGTGAAAGLRDADLARPMFDGPLDHGFDYSLALLAGIQNAPYAFFENDRLARWNSTSDAFNYFETDAEARRHFEHRVVRGLTDDKTTPWTENYYMDNYVSEQVGPLLTFKALEFIDRHVAGTPDQPFFVHFCTEGAHYPFTPPVDLSPDNPDRYNQPGRYPVAGKTPTLRTDMVYETDVITGVIVEKLKTLGVYDNTILIYASDNGAAQYASQSYWDDPRYFIFKWGVFGGNRIDMDAGREGRVINPQGVAEDGHPLKGQKGDACEGGHRVPVIISGGVKTPFAASVRGTESRRLIGLHDLFSTLCELAAVKIPEGQAQDSISFAGLLKTGKEDAVAARTDLMVECARIPMPYEQTKIMEIAANGNWKLQTNADGVVTGLSGKNAPDNKRISNMLEKDRQARAVYLQESGKKWKLIVTTHKKMPAENLEPWELYELISDPDESENLITNPEYAGRIQELLDFCKTKLRSERR